MGLLLIPFHKLDLDLTAEPENTFQVFLKYSAICYEASKIIYKKTSMSLPSNQFALSMMLRMEVVVFSSVLEVCSTFRNRENRSKSLMECLGMNLLTYREQSSNLQKKRFKI